MTPKQLIDALQQQHTELDICLKKAINLSEINENKNAAKIVEELNIFSKLLQVHLKLEDEQFYPQYIEKKKSRGEDTETTLLFIEQMKDIGNVVVKFIEKYVNKKNIDLNSSLFTKELKEVANTLNLRIETEEDGVYQIFLAIA